MKVLVTGSTSLLGGAVAELLRARGDDVTVFQRRPSGVGCAKCSATSPTARAVDAAVAGADVVIHAAAKVDVVGPWSAFEATNITGTANLLDGVRGQRGRPLRLRVVAFGRPRGRVRSSASPAGPADPDRARDNYSRSKAAAEQLGARGRHRRPVRSWRCAPTSCGDRVTRNSSVASSRRARQGRLAIVGSGAALIDTTYIDNAADAIVAAADRAERLNGRALVVSNGQPRPVRELLNRIATAAGLGPPRLRVPAGLARAAGTVFEQVWGRLAPR